MGTTEFAIVFMISTTKPPKDKDFTIRRAIIPQSLRDSPVLENFVLGYPAKRAAEFRIYYKCF
jgi:hypothetical protein